MRPQTTNGIAIAALVVSLVPVCGANAIVALVLGIVALNQIKHTDQGGRGLAIAGIVISAVQLALGLTWVILVVVLANSATSSSSSIAHLGGWVPR
jgi:Na+/H+-dicarboxylate symporter